MISYFGGKSKLVLKYAPPKYSTIVEPFAGGARYACAYGLERDVWLNDKYQVIYRIWKWIRSASVSDLLSLPELDVGDDLRNYTQLSDVERDLLGFCVGQCRSDPGNILTGWAARDGEIARTKKRLLPYVGGKIAHWKITCLDFSNVMIDSPSTYFVDPPYQHRKSDYKIYNDATFYSRLAKYCRSRSGQVIVCEGEGADWLPFEHLHSIRGQRRQSVELVCNLENV